MPENARGATVDLTDLAAVEQLAAEVGDIDHLVYTAGDAVTMAPVADLTPEMITGFFKTRFVGALTAVRVFAPRLTAGGSITLTSGHAAEQPQFGALPVSLCGAMNALTTALAVELAPIRVNAVAPGHGAYAAVGCDGRFRPPAHVRPSRTTNPTGPGWGDR